MANEFRLEIEGIRELQTSWNIYTLPEIVRGTQTALKHAIDAGAAVARQLAPDKTGELRRSISSALTKSTVGEAGAFKSVEGEIRADAAYASYVEHGTRPHDIYPKEGHGFVGPTKSGQGRRAATDIGTRRIALRWMGSDGEYHFARVVHHHGSKSHPFMGPAHTKTEQAIEAKLDEEVTIAVERFNARE